MENRRMIESLMEISHSIKHLISLIEQQEMKLNGNLFNEGSIKNNYVLPEKFLDFDSYIIDLIMQHKRPMHIDEICTSLEKSQLIPIQIVSTKNYVNRRINRAIQKDKIKVTIIDNKKMICI